MSVNSKVRTYNELRDIAFQLVTDMSVAEDCGGNICCYMNKDLYNEFCRVEENYYTILEANAKK